MMALAYSCKPNFVNQSQKAITDASNRFPNLPLLNTKNIGHFELLKSLDLVSQSVKLQLYAPADVYYNQQVIVLSNAKGSFYAVPLPSSRFKKYWNFEYDTSPKPSILESGTFKSEINRALEKLHLNDRNKGIPVIFELFSSLLNYRYIMPQDTSILKIGQYKHNDLPDSCVDVQKRNNHSLIASGITAQKNWISNAYCGNNGLIIQMIFPSPNKKFKQYYRFKTYRSPCIIDFEPINI